LREVIRQRDPAERAALEALHDGDAERYLDHTADQITLHTTQSDALDAVTDSGRSCVPSTARPAWR
jgi:hypothetical protein